MYSPEIPHARTPSSEVDGPAQTFPSALKRYNADPAKDKSRLVLLDLVRAELLPHISPLKMEVLCLPGIDLAEILQVYDAIGIPRANITGIERDPTIAAAIRERNPGIKIVESTVDEFISSLRSLRFHVISLDYTGPFSETHMESVRALARANSAKRYVLHHASSARRDRDSFYVYAAAAASGVDGTIPLHPRERFTKVLEAAREQHSDLLETRLMGGSVQNYRSNAITQALFGAINNPFSSQDLRKLFDICAKSNSAKLIAHHAETASKGLGESVPLPGDPDCLPFTPIFQYWLTVIESYTEDMLRRAHFSEAQRIVIRWAALYSVTAKYAMGITRADRYSYVSESGCPMVGDILVVNDFEQIRVSSQSLIAKLDADKATATDVRAAMEVHLQRYGDNINFTNSILSRERIFLGNASRPLLTRKRAFAEFEAEPPLMLFG